MSHVDLGFAHTCEAWQVESDQFPSKIGGKPAWLDLENLPNPENLQCDKCHQPSIFLCQIYAPFEQDDKNFHRTIFVFICRNQECCVRNSSDNVKVFRSSLPRCNKFYSAQPPKEEKDENFSVTKWTDLCVVCGCLGTKKCSKCKNVTYCGRQHQIVDWREGHKSECEKEEMLERMSLKLFPVFELVIEVEEIYERFVDEIEELEKFSQLKIQGKSGTMSDVSDDDLERYACDTDKVFVKFKKRVADNSDQVLRYERGGEPLWIAKTPRPDHIPNCEYCAGPRQFEFQIMPQLLAVLHENDLDIGVLAVYTCTNSCTEGQNYKKEFVFKQDVALSNC